MDRSNRPALRVLVVEDCPDTTETLALLLALWGHEVQAERDGRAALANARRFRPGAVLCDLGLPVMDGFELGRRLRATAELCRPVLIAATGYDGQAVRQAARAAGFDHFLPKPFDLPHLRDLLAELSPAGRAEPSQPVKV